MSGSITSANSIFLLGATNLFDVAQRMQDFSADDISSHEAMQVAETMMGVDGYLAYGFVNTPMTQNMMLMAKSDSIAFFETLYTSQKQIQDIYPLYGSITYPSRGVKYTLTNGVLTNYAPVADARRVLQPRRFTLVWESCLPAPL